MPQFHFDIDENGRITVDDAGLSLEGTEAAQREATFALCELASETLPGCSHAELAIDVRHKDGSRVLRARLVFDVEATEVDVASAVPDAD